MEGDGVTTVDDQRCATCGAALDAGAVFCGACGARVGAPAATPGDGTAAAPATPVPAAPGTGAPATSVPVTTDRWGGGPVDPWGAAPAAATPATRVAAPAPAARAVPVPAAEPTPGWSLGADVDDAVAPVWRRLVALLVDQVLAALVAGAGALVVLPTLRSEDATPAALLVPALLLLLLAAGQWFAEAFAGRTLGGALLGTRTVSARTGRPAGLWAILVRSVVQALGGVLAGIGVYVVAGSGAWDEGPERRGWHDKAAGTLVLRARPPHRTDTAADAATPAALPAPTPPRPTPTTGPPPAT
ncbi:RDD family protein, partial [Cellulomonas triticagri]